MADEITFVKVDAKEISDELIRSFEQAYGETLYPADERRIFLQQEAQVIVGLKNDINDSARQNLLRYARGAVLDELGKDRTTPRLVARKAVVTLRFTLSAAQPVSVTISKGTRATPDGTIYFATTQNLIVPVGESYGEVKAESVEAGSKYNKFAPGQIKTIVDPVPFVSSVTNTDTSSGGADVEDDDSYRERIRLAPESYSVAGPEGAYIYWAKTADLNIGDLSITSPTPGVVKITVLMKNGELPQQTVLDAVAASCSDKKRRPLTDQVVVQPPTIVSYTIDLTYYISKDRATDETNIRNAIEKPGGAIDQYKAWQSAKLGRAVNPDFLRQVMLNAGAFRINLTAPIYTDIDTDKVAVADTVTVSYGGLI